MKGSRNLSALVRNEAALRGAQLVAGGFAIGLILWRLQFSTRSICCGDFDGYYHIMWSRMLWEGIKLHRFPPQFIWLPLTTLNPKDYVDHHLLFHIFQIPFTWFRDLRLGAKIASLLFATLAVFSCYWLIIRYRIRYPLVWLVALLGCSAPFLYRIQMAKAPPFAILYLIIGIHFLFQKKYWPLLPLAFAFTLTYDLFISLLGAAVIWAISVGWADRRFEWKPMLFVLIGIAAGLVINPYFPHNLYLLYEHARIKLTLSGFSTKVGGEWYPYETWEFLGNSVVACTAMLVGYIAFDPAERRQSHQPLFFLLFSTMLMIMTARWKRIAEYWPPFAVLFAAFALQPWLSGGRSPFARLPSDVMEELKPFLDLHESTEAAAASRRAELIGIICAAVAAVLLAIPLLLNIHWTRKDIGDSEPPNHYKAGMDWIKANVPPGEIIFNTDWDDFPRMFYFDPTHRYVSGLDPTYLYDRSADLSQLYDRITLGKEPDPGPLIRDRFGTRYVFTDNTDDHADFLDHALHSGWLETVYEDRDCAVLHIRDQKLPPPPEPSDDDNPGGDDNGANKKP